MPRKEHSFEMRQMAEELYVEEGLTYEEVSRQLEIGVNTVKTWGADGKWTDRRKEYLEARRTLKENLAKLRQAMIEKATNNLDPQDVYAVIRLEKLARERRQKQEEQGPDIDRPRVFLENLEFVVDVLKELDPEGLKVLARNFDTIIHRFKEANEKAA